MKSIVYKPIGVIHSPFNNIEGMPIQPTGAKGIKGTIELFPEYSEGLEDLSGFSHVILLYHFHRNKNYSLKVVPFLDDRPHGIFATRAPRRPNPIGISVVRLKKATGKILHVEDLDILDGTPVLDIKPYIPQFDAYKTQRIGWFSKNVKKTRRKKSDGRFK